MNKIINLKAKKVAQRATPATYEIRCSWCGALIRSSTSELPEQMCLICHARMLNDYFQRVKKGSRRET